MSGLDYYKQRFGTTTYRGSLEYVCVGGGGGGGGGLSLLLCEDL